MSLGTGAFVRLRVRGVVCSDRYRYAGATHHTKNQGEPMKTFVIIFRQSPPTPTPEERQRTAADVVEWAQRVNADGHKLDPRILAPEESVRASRETSRFRQMNAG